ncbi:hypothetical protein [Actinoplanes auranticolor]|uniref:hypothetical protein n=1 Tax=Actinoplanes auranticolor TaxID=47988 RepID=UPI001BB33956|nr:hypothetical protein [Actinoplanes auranticolor]
MISRRQHVIKTGLVLAMALEQVALMGRTDERLVRDVVLVRNALIVAGETSAAERVQGALKGAER